MGGAGHSSGNRRCLRVSTDTHNEEKEKTRCSEVEKSWICVVKEVQDRDSEVWFVHLFHCDTLSELGSALAEITK